MARREQEIVVSTGAGGLGAAVAAETGGALGEVEAIRARGYWELIWRRFRRDKVAIGSGAFIILLILIAFAGAPIAKHYVGHGPNDLFLTAPAVNLAGLPANPWTHVTNEATGKKNVLVLGAANRLGQDEFLRLIYGARISLEVAGLSTLGVMIIGVLLGATAGYFRGWVDTIISRLTEVTMAFPLLIFVISLAATVGPQLDKITLGIFPKGVLTLVVIFSLFGWFYPARIMRAQVLSIREKEYVEAARMIGASNTRIIRSHVLPHLVAPIIVYSTLTVASYVLLEAGLSFLGVGIKFEPSWGNLLSSGPDFYTTRPLLMVWPGLAVLLTTLAFNLLGDGLRDAFDPRASNM
ncbi:MAG: ABC transporter permease [Actinobacteria bacterium]|nr:MAG: ABC transporter permease [Actinomycetota bacterium]